MNLRWMVCSVCLAAMVGLLGCNGSSGTAVKGTVKYSDGTPVSAGLVQFSGDKFSATGEIKSDGSYEMGSINPGDGVPPGTYKVSIGGDAMGSAYDKKPPLVDPKFSDAATSGLTVTVKEGSAQDFPITVEKPK